LSLLIAAIVLGLSRAQAPDDDELNALQEKAMKAAALKVAPSVVQIETTGGTELISTGGPKGAMIRKGVGPTTGLIVGADGHIITSSFNFANKPTAIRVRVPGKGLFPARIVASDQTRMLTLIKIDADNLPVPTPTPKKSIQVGQWTVALGRALDVAIDSNLPSMSLGIVSALDRIWGKAIQTDAKVSPVNYGGPIVDVHGRVQGILVPASPRGQDETAGFEWYDSGIGFAIPLEDVLAVLPRLKEGKDLKRGLLGITLQSPDIYGAIPVVGSVAPDSAAAKAGIQAGDTILEIDGHKVVRQAQILHLLGGKYEGDQVAVKIKRGDKEMDLGKLTLSGAVTAFNPGFLGVLPMRDDPELGVEVRYVYPKSPADAAGLKAGDRIMKVGAAKGALRPFSGRDELMALLATAPAGTAVQIEVNRKGGKTETLTLPALTSFPEDVPEKLPQPATLKKALEPRKTVAGKPIPKGGDKKEDKKEADKKDGDKKKAETGLLKRTNAARDREYWAYVPENYDPNIAHALVIWLHPAGEGGKDADKVSRIWRNFCEDNHIILVAPKAENDTGWVPSDIDFLLEATREVMGQYTIDHKRVVAHGFGVGGQMAFYTGFNARDLVRGVATTGAMLNTTVKDPVPNQRLEFFIVAGGKDPLAKDIADAKPRLTERKFPVVLRTIENMGHQYLDEDTLLELVRWIDSLDRQ
jgi:S1-C subfamily serine protease/acetyl esterase/lipase